MNDSMPTLPSVRPYPRVDAPRERAAEAVMEATSAAFEFGEAVVHDAGCSVVAVPRPSFTAAAEPPVAAGVKPTDG